MPYFRAVPKYLGKTTTFVPNGYYEAIGTDECPVMLYGEHKESDIAEVCASKTVAGALQGAYSALLNLGGKAPDYAHVYKIMEEPNVDISWWTMRDFGILREVRYRRPVQGIYIGRHNYSRGQIGRYRRFYAQRNPSGKEFRIITPAGFRLCHYCRLMGQSYLVPRLGFVCLKCMKKRRVKGVIADFGDISRPTKRRGRRNPLSVAGETDLLRQQGIQVQQVGSRRLKDYAGMNDEAAKAMGFPLAPRTVLVNKSMSAKDKAETLKHERVERGLMGKGMKYWPAHKRALKCEDRNPIFKTVRGGWIVNKGDERELDGDHYKLAQRLFNFGGNVIHLDPDDEDLPLYEPRGRFMQGGPRRTIFVPMSPSRCHENVSRIWRDHPNDYTWWTGYALYRGMWNPHSWLVRVASNALRPIVETTLVRDFYFGVALTESEAAEFASWY